MPKSSHSSKPHSESQSNSSSHSHPSLSILIPIYNVERYLRECLDSVTNQTLQDIEIICLNDGSTDSSLDIIKTFADQDPRIIIIDKPNSGYGDSMNQGLARATGEYIGIVESDDYINLDAFEKLLALAKKYNADVVKSNFYRFTTPETFTNPQESPQPYIVSQSIEKVNRKSEKSLPISLDPSQKAEKSPKIPLIPSKSPEESQKISEIPADFPEQPFSALDNPFVFQLAPAIWSAIYRRNFLEEDDIKFLPTPGASYQDISFSLKVWLLARRIILTPAAYLHYRTDNASSSINNPGKVFCVTEEYAEVDRFFQDHHLSSELLPALNAAKFRNYHWNLQRLSDPLATEFYPTMVRDLQFAQRADQLRRSDFNLKHWLSLQLMLHNPRLAFQFFRLRSRLHHKN